MPAEQGVRGSFTTERHVHGDRFSDACVQCLRAELQAAQKRWDQSVKTVRENVAVQRREDRAQGARVGWRLFKLRDGYRTLLADAEWEIERLEAELQAAQEREARYLHQRDVAEREASAAQEREAKRWTDAYEFDLKFGLQLPGDSALAGLLNGCDEVLGRAAQRTEEPSIQIDYSKYPPGTFPGIEPVQRTEEPGGIHPSDLDASNRALDEALDAIYATIEEQTKPPCPNCGSTSWTWRSGSTNEDGIERCSECATFEERSK